MQALDARAVEEAPNVALPSLDLSAAPKEDPTALGVDGCHQPDDREAAAWSGALAIGNLQPQPKCAGISKLHPVEIDVALTLLLEEQTGLGLGRAHDGRLVSRCHRMRDGMKVGAVHGIH